MIEIGGTRVVIKLFKVVIKFPRYERFSEGVTQNIIEGMNQYRSKHLTKIYFQCPLFVIAERIRPFKKMNFADEGTGIIENYFKDIVSEDELNFLLEDGAIRNFGIRGNRILKLDWGGFHEGV